MTPPEKLFPNGPEWTRAPSHFLAELPGIVVRLYDSDVAIFNSEGIFDSYEGLTVVDALTWLRTRIIAHRDELNRIIGE